MDTKELLAVIADNTFDPINPQHLTAITSLQKMLVELLEKPRYYWAKHKQQTWIEPVKLAYREDEGKLMIEVLGCDGWGDLFNYTLLARIPDYKAN